MWSLDLQALTLVGPTKDNLTLEPLAVLHLNNWLCIWISGVQNSGLNCSS